MTGFRRTRTLEKLEQEKLEAAMAIYIPFGVKGFCQRRERLPRDVFDFMLDQAMLNAEQMLELAGDELGFNSAEFEQLEKEVSAAVEAGHKFMRPGGG